MMRVRRARHAAVVMAGLVASAVIWLSLGLASSTSHNAPVHHWGVTGYLNSLACPSPTSCFAVGFSSADDSNPRPSVSAPVGYRNSIASGEADPLQCSLTEVVTVLPFEHG